MLLTLLTWHVAVTAALLAVYALVAGLQWSTARLSGARRAVAVAPAVPVPVPVLRRDDEAVVLTRAA